MTTRSIAVRIVLIPVGSLIASLAVVGVSRVVGWAAGVTWTEPIGAMSMAIALIIGATVGAFMAAMGGR